MHEHIAIERTGTELPKPIFVENIGDNKKPVQALAVGTLGQWGVKPLLSWALAVTLIPALHLPEAVGTGLILVRGRCAVADCIVLPLCDAKLSHDPIRGIPVAALCQAVNYRSHFWGLSPDMIWHAVKHVFPVSAVLAIPICATLSDCREWAASRCSNINPPKLNETPSINVRPIASDAEDCCPVLACCSTVLIKCVKMLQFVLAGTDDLSVQMLHGQNRQLRYRHISHQRSLFFLSGPFMMLVNIDDDALSQNDHVGWHRWVVYLGPSFLTMLPSSCIPNKRPSASC